PWELLLCSSCAAQGTHRRCSNLDDSTSSWECNACAGLDTDSSTTSLQELGVSPRLSGIGEQHFQHHQPGTVGNSSWFPCA
ncbi:UNVERIFIED_CONTAM: hypothetical protein H355_006873, partial [Colinus virginianus]